MTEALRQAESGDARRLARLVAGDDWEGAVKFATELAKEELGPRASRQIEGWVTGLFEKRWGAGKAVKEIWEEARGAAFTRLEAERAKATEEEKAAKCKAIEDGTEAVKEFRAREQAKFEAAEKAAREQPEPKAEPKIVRRENVVVPKLGEPAAEAIAPEKPLRRLKDEPPIVNVVANLPAVIEQKREQLPESMLAGQCRMLVELMNRKHAVIGNVGGKCRVLDWVPADGQNGILVPTFQTIADFRNRYNDEPVFTDEGKVERGNFWLDRKDKAKFDGILFCPGKPAVISIGKAGDLPTISLNMWRGWGVEAAPGDWSRIRWHIENILGGGNEEMVEYILNWTAFGFQSPGVKRRTALVLRGKEGSGKGVFGHAIRRAYGHHGLYIAQPSHLTGKFNKHLWTACFVFADEAFWAGDRQAEQILKSLITDELLTIEPKGIDPIQSPNYIDLMLASNDDWVVPAGPEARRYAVSDVDNRYAKGQAPDAERKAYFGPLWDELARGGIEAMMWDLKERDLSEWDPEAVPQTAALVEQKRHSLRGFNRWYESALQTGVLPRNRDWDGRPDCATTEAMMEAAKEIRGCEYETDASLKKFLLEMGCNIKWRVGGSGIRGAKFPPLSEAREIFAKPFGGRWPWTEEIERWGG